MNPILHKIKSTKKTEEEITSLYKRDINHSLLELKIMSGIIGKIILGVTIVCYFFLPIYIVALLGLISFLFIKYYHFENTFKTDYFGCWETSPYWQKNQKLFTILLLVNFSILLFLVYVLTAKIILSILL